MNPRGSFRQPGGAASAVYLAVAAVLLPATFVHPERLEAGHLAFVGHWDVPVSVIAELPE